MENQEIIEVQEEKGKDVEVAYGIAVYLDKTGNIGYTFIGDQEASLHEMEGLSKYLQRALDKRWDKIL